LHRPRDAADSAQQAREAVGAELAFAQAIVGDGFAHRDRRASVDRIERGQQRNADANDDFEQEYVGRHAERREGHVDEPAQELGQCA
jgi:hypothetical protein